MIRERMENLLRVAEQIPEDEVYMGKFCQKVGCKTVYCLAGYAANDSYFIEEGLHIEFGDLASLFNFPELRQFFDISPTCTTRLFGGNLGKDAIIKKGAVVENVRRVLERKTALRYDANTGGLVRE